MISPSRCVLCEEENAALFIVIALHCMVAESSVQLPEAS